MKLFSTKTQGVLDYMSAGLLFALPRMLGWRESTTQLLTGAALGTVGYSLLTAYELGAVKALPRQTHLSLDAMQGFLLGAAPFLFLKEDKAVTASLVGIGLFELFAALNTEARPRQVVG
jgi:hypothetical protein